MNELLLKRLIVHCGRKRDGHGQEKYSGRLWCFDGVHLVLRGPKISQQNIIMSVLGLCGVNAVWLCHITLLFCPPSGATFHLKTASIRVHLHLQSETMHSGSYLMRPKLM